MAETGHLSSTREDMCFEQVLVIIVNYNGGSSLVDCVASVIAQDVPAMTVVVDNGSTDGSESTIHGVFPEVTVRMAPHNPGFGTAVNLAVAENQGQVIVVLNPDIVLGAGCLSEAVSALRARPGVVGPVLRLSASGSIEAGSTINHAGMPTVQAAGKPPLYLPGCALVTSRSIFERVGGFDERYFLFVEDVEFCWRVLLAGFDVSIAPDAHATHEGGGSAEGGYLKVGSRYRTTDLRVALRERNNIALMIACAPWWWLPVVIPLLVGHSLVVAGGAMALGRPSLALSLVKGMGWNFSQLGASVRRRRSLPRSRLGCRRARVRFTSGPLLLRAIRGHGLPEFR